MPLDKLTRYVAQRRDSAAGSNSVIRNDTTDQEELRLVLKVRLVVSGTRQRATRVVLASVSLALVTGLPHAAQATTTVVGKSSGSSGALLIDPTTDPAAPSEQTMNGQSDVAFIIDMPRTMAVDRVSLGQFGTSCPNTQTLQLYVREGTDGSPANTQQIGVSSNAPVVPATPQTLTFTLTTTVTFVAGRSYLLRVAPVSGCSAFTLRTWAHNSSQVNGGHASCTAGPGGVKKRMWHVKGQNDSVAACVTNPVYANFDPGMPTGWLVSHRPASSWYIVHGSPNDGRPPTDVCWTPPLDLNTLGAVPLDWIPNTVSEEFVCAWDQYGPKGAKLEDGWYHGFPWDAAHGGKPRDTLVQLSSPAPHWNIAKQFAPVLRFDASEQQRPLNVDAFLGEGQHQICDAQEADCAPIGDQSDLATHASPDSFINIAGAITTDPPGFAFSYQSPWSDCLADGLWDCDAGNRSAIYYRATGPYFNAGGAGYRYFDYWAFYRVNDLAPQVNQHEGDWEVVTIAVPAGVSNPTTFDYAALSQHGWFASYLRQNLSCEDTPSSQPPLPGNCGTEFAKTGKRLSVMVSHGGHSNYPRPCSETFLFLSCEGSFAALGRERGYDGTRRWARAFADPTTSVLPMPPDDGSPTGLNWVNWQGYWGKADDGYEAPGFESRVAPEGPLFQSLSFECATTDNPGGDCVAMGPRAASTSSLATNRGRRWAAPSPGLAASRCESWAGGGVSLALCDPVQLRTAVRRGALGPQRTPLVARVAGRRGGRARGITQLMGSPLKSGERVALGGQVPRQARLIMRVEDRHRRRARVATYLVGRAARTGRLGMAARLGGLRLRWVRSAHGAVPVLGGLRPVSLR